MIIEMYRHRVLPEPDIRVFTSDYISMVVPHKKSNECDRNLDSHDIATAEPFTPTTPSDADVQVQPVTGRVRMQPVAGRVQMKRLEENVQTTQPDAGFRPAVMPKFGHLAKMWSDVDL